MSTIGSAASSSAGAFGPHGGPFVLLESGLVELSVFETGVPPVFRLYFFDRDKKPLPPMLPDKVRIETIRVGDKRQTFNFRPGSAYLESTADIPEPHEFTAYVIVSHDGHEHRYETEFTEEGHSHGGHDHGAHSHGDHGHVHGTGVLGWLRDTFTHSHSVVDKVDATMESSDRGIWALKISLLGLGVTALLQVIVVMISGSIALLADTIHNFADAATSLPLWVAFALAKRPPNLSRHRVEPS